MQFLQPLTANRARARISMPARTPSSIRTALAAPTHILVGSTISESNTQVLNSSEVEKATILIHADVYFDGALLCVSESRVPCKLRPFELRINRHSAQCSTIYGFTGYTNTSPTHRGWRKSASKPLRPPGIVELQGRHRCQWPS